MNLKKSFLSAAALVFVFTSSAAADVSSIERYLNSGEIEQTATATQNIEDGTVSTCGDTLNVRSGPSIDSEILGTLDDSAKVQIIGEQDGWYKINWNGTQAWICSRYVNKSPAAAPNSNDYSDSGTSRSPSSTTQEPSSPIKEPSSQQSGNSKTIDVPERCQYMSDGRGGGWCGPTSLGMLMQHYGVNISTEAIADEAYNRSGHGGTDPGDLEAYAKSQGFKVSYSEDQGRSIDYLKEKIDSNTPVVVSLKGDDYWRGGHYVVVRGYNEDGVVINDPSDRNGLSYTMPYNQFSTMWHGSNDDWGCFAMTISK